MTGDNDKYNWYAKLSPEEQAEYRQKCRERMLGTRSATRSNTLKEMWKEVDRREEQRRKVKATYDANEDLRDRTAQAARNWSSEQRGRQRIKMQRKWDDPTYRSKVQHAIAVRDRSLPTSIELAMYDALDQLGIVYESQAVVGGYRVDAYISHLLLVLEADGEYWHSLPWKQRQDRVKDTYLMSKGYRVVRLTERDLLSRAIIVVRNALEGGDAQ